jgi:glycerol-3-phosphate acyltransferase PlsY
MEAIVGKLLGIFFVGYLLGSIPSGYWIAKAYGINIFEVGSGNPGATNVRRTVGSVAGSWVFILDATKGFIAAFWTRYLVETPQAFPLFAMAGLWGAILGHVFPIFLRFRGGRGVAVTIGGLAACMVNVLFWGIFTWMVVFFSTRFVSLASICFALILPLCSYLFGYTLLVNFSLMLLSIFIIVRHGANIRRLLHGMEHRFGKNE